MHHESSFHEEDVPDNLELFTDVVFIDDCLDEQLSSHVLQLFQRSNETVVEVRVKSDVFEVEEVRVLIVWLLLESLEGLFVKITSSGERIQVEVVFGEGGLLLLGEERV